jgi:hypothetical protein
MRAARRQPTSASSSASITKVRASLRGANSSIGDGNAACGDQNVRAAGNPPGGLTSFTSQPGGHSSEKTRTVAPSVYKENPVGSSASARLAVFQSEQLQGRQAQHLDPYCRARSAGGRVKLPCLQLSCMHAHTALAKSGEARSVMCDVSHICLRRRPKPGKRVAHSDPGQRLCRVCRAP